MVALWRPPSIADVAASDRAMSLPGPIAQRRRSSCWARRTRSSARRATPPGARTSRRTRAQGGRPSPDAPPRTAPHRHATPRPAPPRPCWRPAIAPSYTLGRHLLEIRRGGHVSFTSCELYNPDYGNGIGESNSLSRPGEKYTPLPIVQQHAVINAYGLAFLNAHLRPATQGPEVAGFDATYLQENHFDAEEVIWK